MRWACLKNLWFIHSFIQLQVQKTRTALKSKSYQKTSQKLEMINQLKRYNKTYAPSSGYNRIAYYVIVPPSGEERQTERLLPSNSKPLPQKTLSKKFSIKIEGNLARRYYFSPYSICDSFSKLCQNFDFESYN